MSEEKAPDSQSDNPLRSPAVGGAQQGAAPKPSRPDGRVASPLWLAISSALALLMLVGGGWQLAQARSGANRVDTVVSGVPITLLTPTSGPGPYPGVVVAHGFAGSQEIMDGIALALVDAGFAVALPDFAGHGSSAEKLLLTDDTDRNKAQLRDNLDVVTTWLRDRSDVTRDPISLVGHSMGAGAVVDYAVTHAGSGEIGSTVAISLPNAQAIPVGKPQVPANLLLLWGSAELPQFTQAGEEALHAGYPAGTVGNLYGSYADGSARQATIVPGAEHISILWRQQTLDNVVGWTASSRGLNPGSTAPDHRMWWVLVCYLGIGFAMVPLASMLLGNRRSAAVRRVAPLRAAGVMLGAAVVAAGVGWVSGPVLNFLPLAVGGYLALFFAAAAVIMAAGGLFSARGSEASPASVRAIVGGLGLAVVVTLGLALPGKAAWTSFTLVGDRWWLAAMFVLVLLAWFAADELLVRRRSRWGRAGLMALNRVLVLGTLLAAVTFLGAPIFLTLLLPLIAPLFLFLAVVAIVVAARTRSVFAPAAVQAVPVALLVATAFPLVAT